MTSIDIRRGAQRFVTHGDGIESWHSFSFGAHYDADNVSFGPMLAHNEERLAPGAGFEWHEHQHVDLVTYVVTGTLLHEDSSGRRQEVPSDAVQVLHAGRGVTHTERNASRVDPLVFVQTWLRSAAAPSYELHDGLDEVMVSPGVKLRLARAPAGGALHLVAAPYVHVFVLTGRGVLPDGREIDSGDAIRSRADAHKTIRAVEPLDLLVWSMQS